MTVAEILSIEIFRLLLLGFFIWSLFQESWGRNSVAVTPHLDQRDQKRGLNRHCFKAPWQWVWQTFFFLSLLQRKGLSISLYSFLFSLELLQCSHQLADGPPCLARWASNTPFSSFLFLRPEVPLPVLTNLSFHLWSDQVWLWCFSGVWFVDFITFS